MISGGELVVKIIDIDRQHTPAARLCSPRAIRSRKDRRQVSWTQTMHKCYFLAFFAYLGFQVANIITFVYWSSEQITKNQDEPSFSEFGVFQIFENKAHSWMLNSLGYSWCMILSRQSLSLCCVYCNRGMCSSFPFILQVQTMCLQEAMQFKYFDHVHV